MRSRPPAFSDQTGNLVFDSHRRACRFIRRFCSQPARRKALSASGEHFAPKRYNRGRHRAIAATTGHKHFYLGLTELKFRGVARQLQRRIDESFDLWIRADRRKIVKIAWAASAGKVKLRVDRYFGVPRQIKSLLQRNGCSNRS